MAEGLARWTGTFWILHKQKQRQEGKASHGVLHVLLKHGEMRKSSVLPFSVFSPVLLQLFPSSVCVPFFNTHTYKSSFGKRQDEGSEENIHFPAWVCGCRRSVNFYHYRTKRVQSSLGEERAAPGAWQRSWGARLGPLPCRASDTLWLGLLCTDGRRSIPACQSRADLRPPLSEARMSVGVCGAPSVCSGTRGVGI